MSNQLVENFNEKKWGKRHTVFLAVFLTNFIIFVDDSVFDIKFRLN
ncbi:hypothetical protein [Alkalihalobacterium elongatum]|nr:hypothetical protein [Alkalihalobacterium elongatum]